MLTGYNQITGLINVLFQKDIVLTLAIFRKHSECMNYCIAS